MGKTYQKNSKRFEDESSGRSGKHARHANGKKTGGMRTLNSYVDEDIDFEAEDIFDDQIGMEDEISIQHIQNDKP